MANSNTGVIGVGSPIIDLLARVSDAFVTELAGEKGGMELVAAADLERLIARVDGIPERAPGGSAANTVFALARLGIPSAFVGKLGNDADAEYYCRAFEAVGGDTGRFKYAASSPTARCFSMITPDSERTMRTHLGAAMELLPAEIASDDFRGCGHAHVEGYLLFNRALTESVLETAKGAGCTISLDLGSFEVVRAAAGVLPALLDRYVDMVFANEDEAEAFSGARDPREALESLGRHCETVAVKLGADGALLWRAGEVRETPAISVSRVVDTTGAGDCWAAGFLFGCLRGLPLETCGGLGALLGGEAVQHLGAGLGAEAWDRVRSEVKRIIAGADIPLNP